MTRLSPEAYTATVIAAAVAFHAAVMPDDDNTAPAASAPLPVQTGPCSWCGKPGIRIVADRDLHCADHMWPPHRRENS
jgi:hypothetical protein